MSLKYGENSVSINIPLSVKVKKTIQNKKRSMRACKCPITRMRKKMMVVLIRLEVAREQGGSHIIDSN
jgi:hypothetical protein